MKVRELLQTEIWSKRTTRRIWKVVGTVLVVALFCFVVNRFWLTPSERKVARVALNLIDALENSDGLAKEEFDSRSDRAREAVEIAERKAWTARDKTVFELLSIYLDMVKLERSQLDRKLPPKYAQYEQSSMAASESTKMVCIIASHELHASLYE